MQFEFDQDTQVEVVEVVNENERVYKSFVTNRWNLGSTPEGFFFFFFCIVIGKKKKKKNQRWVRVCSMSQGY